MGATRAVTCTCWLRAAIGGAPSLRDTRGRSPGGGEPRRLLPNSKLGQTHGQERACQTRLASPGPKRPEQVILLARGQICQIIVCRGALRRAAARPRAAEPVGTRSIQTRMSKTRIDTQKAWTSAQ